MDAEHLPPDRDHQDTQPHPASRPPADPTESMTDYLVELADQLGFDVDVDQLWVACGHWPRQVFTWVAAGCHHASLIVQRRLLAGPIDFLRDLADPDDQWLLADLLAEDRRLDEALDEAGRRYATCCRTLAETGLTSPHHAGTGDRR